MNPRTRAGSFLVPTLVLLSLSVAAQTSVTVPASKDNTLYAITNGSLSNGAGSGLFAGVSIGGFLRRGLIAFDVAGAVPAGATIVNATLTLWHDMGASPPLNVDLHRVLADWGEGSSVANTMIGFPSGGGGAGAPATTGDATWLHTFYANSFWANQGGDFNPAVSATRLVDNPGAFSWNSPQLIADVQDMLVNPAANFGWMIRAPESGSTAKRFSSREHPTLSERPQLVIEYVTSSPAQATTVGTGCAGSSGVPMTLAAAGLPFIGNSGFGLNVAGGPANGLASFFLAQGLAPAPAPVGGTCNVYLDLNSVLAFISLGVSPIGPIPLSASGAVFLPVPVPLAAAFVGLVIDVQVFAPDGVSPTGFVLSNALRVSFGT